jgi:preprotein translocase subunit YajC
LNHLELLIGMAQQQTGGAAAPQGGCAGGGAQPLIMMGLMFLVFYFLLIRPQQKKAKEHQKMLDELKKGDQVITRGGVIGRVSGVQDNVLTIEVQEKVRLRVLKSYVEGRFQDGTATAAAKPEAAAESKN